MVQERLIDREQLALVIHDEDVVRLAVEDRAREIFRLLLLPVGLPELDDLVSSENQCERGDEQTQRQGSQGCVIDLARGPLFLGGESLEDILLDLSHRARHFFSRLIQFFAQFQKLALNDPDLLMRVLLEIRLRLSARGDCRGRLRRLVRSLARLIRRRLDERVFQAFQFFHPGLNLNEFFRCRFNHAPGLQLFFGESSRPFVFGPQLLPSFDLFLKPLLRLIEFGFEGWIRNFHRLSEAGEARLKNKFSSRFANAESRCQTLYIIVTAYARAVADLPELRGASQSDQPDQKQQQREANGQHRVDRSRIEMSYSWRIHLYSTVKSGGD